MWRKTSKRQSGRPASRTRIRVEGSSESRFASTQPAEPPPTITTSKRSSAITRNLAGPGCGAAEILAGPTGRGPLVLRGRQDADGKPMATGAVGVRFETIGNLSRTPIGMVEPERRGERAAGPE